MNGLQYLKLVGDSRAFQQSAELVEHEIQRLNAKPADLSPIGGATGWPSHSVWESLKTVSHFNLGIALELRLKCLLRLHDIIPDNRHHLAELFDNLREKQPCTATRLEDLFQQAIYRHPFKLEAYLSTDDHRAPEGPRNRALSTLKEFLAYMDEDVQLWNKRYSWESLSENQWQHYIDNLAAFFIFLNLTETLAKNMAQKQGIIG